MLTGMFHTLGFTPSPKGVIAVFRVSKMYKTFCDSPYKVRDKVRAVKIHWLEDNKSDFYVKIIFGIHQICFLINCDEAEARSQLEMDLLSILHTSRWTFGDEGPLVWQPRPFWNSSHWRFVSCQLWTLLNPPWRHSCSHRLLAANLFVLYLFSCKLSLGILKGVYIN